MRGALYGPETGAQGTASTSIRAVLGWVLGKVFCPERGWALEHAPQGSSHSPSRTELQRHWDKVLRHTV